MISFDYYNKIIFDDNDSLSDFYYEKILNKVHGYKNVMPEETKNTYEPMQYMKLVDIVEVYKSKEKTQIEEIKYEYPLTSYVQFEGLDAPKLNVLFALLKYYNLANIVDRTLQGEDTMIINDYEHLINTTDDMIEFNKINLMKRFSYILNFLTLIVYGTNENKTLLNLGYVCPQEGIIVSSEFYNSNTMQFTDTKVCVVFDGNKVRIGRWSVKDLVEKAIENKSLLFITQDSVYPLSLCLNLHRQADYQVISPEERDKLKLKRGNLNAFVNIVLYDAIPGSGKTTKMMDAIKYNKEEALIIVPTKQERDELKAKDFNVYTADSIHHQLTNINSKRNLFKVLRKIKSVHIDECFMMHSGQIQWLLLKIREIQKYTDVFMYGDKGQIPYYSFVNVKAVKSRQLQDKIVNVKTMDITHRCPGCVVPILKEEYKRDVHSTTNIQGTVETWCMPQDKMLKMLHIIKDEFKLVTFTQAEKDILRSNHLQAITIAESQGMTFKNVLLIRLNMYERTIYHSKTHVLVAMTRFKQKFLYYTTTKDDLYSMIDKYKYSYKMSLGTIQNMKLGLYSIGRDSTFEKQNLRNNEDIYINLEIANEHCDYFRNSTVTNPLFTNDQEIINDIDKNNKRNVLAMNKLLDEYSSKYPQNYIDKDEYLRLLIEKKETLETKNVRFNESKFTELLNKEILNYQNKSYYDIIKNCDDGTFLLSNLPRSRYDDVDLLTLLSSIEKRNADPGKIRNFMMTMEPSKVVNNFFKIYVDNNKYNQLKQNIHTLSDDYLTEWKQTRTLQQLNKLQSEKENISKIDFTSYNSFVKTIYKNKFDETQYDIAQAAQIVAGAQALMVEFFTPMVKRFTQILKSVLKDNVLINDGVTTEYIEWFVNNNIQNRIFSETEQLSITPFEMDYSKFDKNQDWIDLYYQLLLLKEFGIDEQILENWACVHLLTTLKFQKYKISMTTFTQRKSGDAFTFMGNTLFTMLMYSTFYSQLDPIVMLFGGDDSLILYDSEDMIKVQDYSEEIAAAFNMEIKYMDTNKSVMFASKLFIFHDDHVFVFPDILKQFSRYNRKVKSKEHAISQQISSYLINRNLFYADEILYNKYLQQLMNRYKLEGDAAELFTIVLNAYMQYVYVGKTYLLYKNFAKLPNANTDEMRKIRKKMQKKISTDRIGRYIPRNQIENRFLQNYMCYENIDIKIGEQNMRREQINVNMLSPNDYHRIYDSFINAIRSYFDSNNISYAKLNINVENCDDYANITNEMMINKSRKVNESYKNVVMRLLSIVVRPFLSSGKDENINVSVNVSNNLFTIVTFDEYVNNLEKIIFNINNKLNIKFKLYVNVV